MWLILRVTSHGSYVQHPRNAYVLDTPLTVMVLRQSYRDGHHEHTGHVSVEFVVFTQNADLLPELTPCVRPLHVLLTLVVCQPITVADEAPSAATLHDFIHLTGVEVVL